LINTDRININQQLTTHMLDKKPVCTLIDIPQNWGFLATWWLHEIAM
jgi:hypothetical protein